MDKKKLSETDIISKFVLPALEASGWDSMTQIRQEVKLRDGKVIVRGQMGLRSRVKSADIVLYYKPNIPLAVIEAKANTHEVGKGMQQGLGYAELLEVPFVFATNGDGFVFHDKTAPKGAAIEQKISLNDFPSPDALWEKYCQWRHYSKAQRNLVVQDYYEDGSGKSPRYYQLLAVNRAIEAIGAGKHRILLVMATGTGKTYTAFQIIWRLWKSGQKKRILFLADRNILVDQTRINDFEPFGTAMTKVTKRKVDPAFEIHLALYQALTGPDESQKAYKQVSRDFFDLIVIDECHRGSASEDSEWRDILNYFSGATHIGLTATPKETEEVSSTSYFGEPVYTYSLKQGIEDGFLAPYKVIRVDIDVDLQGWRPESGQTDQQGLLIEDRIYNQRDFDRTMIIDERTDLVAQTITAYLKRTDPMAKTIVFCNDIDHAERMRRALINHNPEQAKKSDKYVMRITGDDEAGKAQLENFINAKKPYPVIATTSELMTTGVDAKTCKLVVLDQIINSMTKFKQIIGRGTRIDEKHNKLWFTIMDFKKATELFADPGFDGIPEGVIVTEPETIIDTEDDEFDEQLDGNTTDESADDTPHPPEDDATADAPPDNDPLSEAPFPEEGSGMVKYYVNGVNVNKIAERVQYYDTDGKLVTESFKDYTRKQVKRQFASLDEFVRKWQSSERKKAIIDELAEEGVLWEALRDDVSKDLDAFDLICHVAFDQPPLTRKERAENVKKRNYFARYSEAAQKVLQALLDKYEDGGVSEIESMNVLKVQPLNQLGTPREIVQNAFGSKKEYEAAIQALEQALYENQTG